MVFLKLDELTRIKKWSYLVSTLILGLKFNELLNEQKI